MIISFLGQSYNEKTHRSTGGLIIESLLSKNYTAFTGIAAFASDAAVNMISDYLLQSTISKVTLIVGIDQRGTSRKALEQIEKLKVNSFIFYQKESIIFHPKIYLFEGEEKTRLIIGSSNLTVNGLFTNVESSLSIDFDNLDEDGNELLKTIKQHYETLFDYSDPNLFKITTDVIDSFVKKGIVPEKSVWINHYQKTIPNDNVAREDEEALDIPKRKVIKLPKGLRGTTGIPKSTVDNIIEEAGIDIDDSLNNNDLNLVWESKGLTERDLGVPTGPNTNPSGSMLLGKGQTQGIDQKHYFRESVFSALTWHYDARHGREHIERSEAYFNIYTDGKLRGKYLLKLKHDTRIDSPSYRQNNSMTAVSWGTAKSIVSRREYLGKIAKLFRHSENPSEFTLVIE